MRRLAGTVTLPIALYVVAAGLLLFDLGSHPAFTYNWENNTLQGLFPFMEEPSLSPFKLLEGLMTDSGSSPWVVFPAWAGFGWGGVSLFWLRAPLALLAAMAVPLLYVVGCETIAPGSKLRVRSGALPLRSRILSVMPIVAALLLALSPVYLLYARTATVVGVSLVPALLTVLALYGVLQRPDLWWRTGALLGTLVLGAYAYAPIRFLWPMCVGLLLLEAFARRKEKARKRRLVASALLLVVAMAGFITAFDFEHDHDPIISVGYYYAGRGEQIANLLVNGDEYNEVVSPELQIDMPSVEGLAWSLVTKNVVDMANLFLDRETQPALSDYWNPHGRLIPSWVVPLLAVGFLRAGWLGLRRKAFRWRVVVLLFLGFTLPMLLTSQVHIGRLIFALPLICLFVTLGLVSILDFGFWILDLPGPRRGSGAALRSTLVPMSDGKGLLTRPVPRSGVYRVWAWVSVVVIAGLVVCVGWSTWMEYSIDAPPTYEALVTPLLRSQVGEAARRGGGLALVTGSDEGLTLEEINSNQYRLLLRDAYHLYNLATGDIDVRRPGDTRPALFIGGLMDRLKEPEKMPSYCQNVYLVSPNLIDQFKALADSHSDMCPEPVVYHKLP